MSQEALFPSLVIPSKKSVDNFREFVCKNTKDVFMKQDGAIQPCLFCDDGEQLYMTIVPSILMYIPEMACSMIESISTQLPNKVRFKGYAVSAWKASEELITQVKMGVDIEQVYEKLKSIALGEILPKEGDCEESLFIYLRMEDEPLSSFEIWRSMVTRSEVGISLSEWSVPNTKDALGSVFDEYFGGMEG